MEIEQVKQEEEAIVSHFANNFATLFASVLMAYFLAKSGILEELLTKTVGAELLGTFIAGAFFTSLVSAAPAMIALGSIAQEFNGSLMLLAFIGGAGALIGDLFLYVFLRTHVSDELYKLAMHPSNKRMQKLMHLRAFRWLIGFLGAIIIASPLPDELGLALMGVGKMRLRFILPLSFVFNTIGIYIIGVVARQIA